MRVSRLLTLVGLLQARGTMTAEQLAGALGVSRRTVYRDVEILASAGVRLEAEHGPAGGYRIPRDAARTLLALTRADAEALTLAQVVAGSLAADLDADAERAAAKLQAALGPEARERVAAVRRRFHVREPAPRPAVAEAMRAVRVERWVRLTAPGAEPLELRALGMVHDHDGWQLVADDGARRSLHRLDETTELVVLDAGFEPPPGFDVARAWEALEVAHVGG
jgi:predicted DNA-binding transcriptional regulator YafY